MPFGLKKISREMLIRRHLVPTLIGIAITGIMTWAGIYQIHDISVLRAMEYVSYDIRLRQSQTYQADDRVVIIDVDEKSLAEQGRWPWPRQTMAKLVEKLGALGAQVIAFDVVFAEPEERSDRRILSELLQGPLQNNAEFVTTAQQKMNQLDGDKQFAEALASNPVVMGFFFDAGTDATSIGMLPNNGADASSYLDAGVEFGAPAESFGANLELLQSAATSGGFFNTRLDPDGILRRVPLFTLHGNEIYPLLSLEAVRLYLGEPGWQLATDTLLGKKTLDYVMLGDHRINTDRVANMLIPYRGGARTFTYISATDVLSDKLGADSLVGKIVFVGTSAKGLLDLRPTPVETIYPGVEVHATIADAILNGGIRAETLEKDGIDLVLLAGLGILLSVLLTLISPLWAIISTLIAATLVVIINFVAWSNGIVLALSTPLLTIALILGANLAYGFLFESRDRRLLQAMFGQYVPPELVAEMSQDADSFNLDGESRLMTVLFADIRSFTSISETMSPKQLKDLLNRYFTPMTSIIHDQRGTIDKYVGDMIMAFWGAPLDDPNHARNGVIAALEMIRQTEAMTEEFRAIGYPDIRIGVGLNTGPMNVGNMGSEFRMAYTVLGDSVNLGSRLESLTKQYGANILVSEDTRRTIDDVVFMEIDRVVVKGQTRPITIYEPLCQDDQLTVELRDELVLAQRALKLYRAKDWDNAEMQYISLMQRYPNRKLYELYVKERIPWFRQNPPPAKWAGEFIHTSK